MSLLLPILPKFSGRPSPEIRASLEKNYILGSSLEGLSTLWISFNLKELENFIIFSTIRFAVKHKTEQ